MQDINTVLKYLERQKTTIDTDEFKFQLKSHPDYPSLLSFSDGLSFFGISNYAIDVAFESFNVLPDRFVALLKEKDKKSYFLSFVEKQNEEINYYKNGKLTTVNRNDLKDIWSRKVLLTDADQDVDLNYKSISKINIYSIVTLFLVLVLFFFFLRVNKVSLVGQVIFLISSIGLYLSHEALKKSLGVSSGTFDKFCNTLGNSDCNSVIKNKKEGILKVFNFTDISFLFFCIQWLLFFIGISSGFYSNLITLFNYVFPVSIVISLYSIYYQKNIVKEWCPVCLSIILVLFIQSYLGITHYNFIIEDFSVSRLIPLFIISLLVLLLFYTTKPFFENYFKLETERIEAVKFKRNYDLFKYSLFNKSIQVPEDAIGKTKFKIGSNKLAKIKINIFTSLFCSYCAKAHKVLESILKDSEEYISLEINFNHDPEFLDESAIKIHNTLYQIYDQYHEQVFMEVLENWFKNKELNTPEDFVYDEQMQPDSKAYFYQQHELHKSSGLTFTPAIVINGYVFPSIYKIEDLVYFIQELIEDDDL